MRRTAFKRKPISEQKPMRRTSLKKVGRVGKINIEANKRIKLQNPVQYCEIQLDNCLGTMFLTIAHKHKRAWYKGNVELLSDPKEYVVGCVNCHNLIEHNQELTDKIFKKCRSN
jgi:hypothetical protein